MATNWRRPLSAGSGSIETPEPRALLEALNFFDFRAVHGGLDLDPLLAAARPGGREPMFLAHLARASMGCSRRSGPSATSASRRAAST